MAVYRNKEHIDAIQVDWCNWNKACDFIPKKFFGGGVYLDDETMEELPEGISSNTIGIKIKSPHGWYIVPQGDYIVKGNKNGYYYPIKKDVFETRYELVSSVTTE